MAETVNGAMTALPIMTGFGGSDAIPAPEAYSAEAVTNGLYRYTEYIADDVYRYGKAKLLNVIEATYSDPQRLEAVKAVVEDVLDRMGQRVWEFYHANRVPPPGEDIRRYHWSVFFDKAIQ